MTLHFPQNNYLIKTAETQTNQMKYTLATMKAYRNTDEKHQAFILELDGGNGCFTEEHNTHREMK
jgi:hypothetical protein